MAKRARAGTRSDGVAGTTRVVGIFGDPVDHSLSPRMHNAAFRALGLDYVSCSPYRVPVARLAAAHAALQKKS